MGLSIERIEILLLIAAVVAMLARRLRVPYSVGLVFAGIALALLPFSPNVILTKQLVFTVFLPPLIFEAAFQLRWPELRRDLPVIVTLATLGVLLSAAATAIGMHFLARWPWISAIVFGMLISATDPVSVIATFKDAKVHGRIRLLVEAESLFNDATAAVAFTLALLFASGQSIGVAGITKTLAIMIAGSFVCGAIMAAFVLPCGSHGRSSGRDHIYHCGSFWLLLAGRAFSSLRRSSDTHGGLNHRQRWSPFDYS